MDQPPSAFVAHDWHASRISLPASCNYCQKNALAVFKCKACGYLLHKECLAKAGPRGSGMHCTKQPYIPPKEDKKEDKKEDEEKREKRSLSGIFRKKDKSEPLIAKAEPAKPAAAPTTTATAGVVNDAHAFDVANLTRPTYCDLCKDFIWGLAKQAFRCKACEFTIHKKCLIKVPASNKCVTNQIELVKKLEELQEQLKRAESSKAVAPTTAAAPAAAAELPKVENLEISNKPAPTASTTTGGGAPDDDDDDDDDDMCVICWQNKINTVLLECGHRCVCLSCSAGMDQGKLCPICRATVARVVRIYDAH